jgi:RNA polymerase sigma-70 factor (ECF subfamily)
MTDKERTPTGGEDEAVVAAARAGDEAAFGLLAERHRRKLQLHCYRMLGSFEEAEDLVQETFLRAWRGRGSFEGRSSFRAWLYRIATNACLDTLKSASRRAPRAQPRTYAEIPWLQPFPDRLLDEIAASDPEPDAAIVARETIELAFLVAIQCLTPRQRAVLILRDVLGWPPGDIAALLETSVASANSALQRARAALRERRPAPPLDWAPAAEPREEERAVLQRYMDAHARADAAAVVALLHQDARVAMPPLPTRYEGRAAVAAFFEAAFGRDRIGDLRLVPTRANRQPAAANYLRRWGDSAYRAMSLDVLRVEDGAVVEITVFEPHLFAAFGLPPML